MSESRLEELLGEAGEEEVIAAIERMFPTAALYVVDPNQRIVYWNEGAERLLGFSTLHAVGNHCLQSIRCTTCMKGCGIHDPGVVRGVRMELFDREGRTVPVRKYASALRGTDGGLVGGVELLIPEDEPARGAQTSADGDLLQLGAMESREASMHELFRLVERLASTEVTVLIRGDSGTGKELIAQAIHEHSPRHDQPMVSVNCATLSPSLIESELFGHVRGAFTGAIGDRAGLFVEADGGTLFLDEVAELPMELQANLLRVLQERKVRPVGGNREHSVDVRVIAATHRSLREEVARGRFREDLLYRLRVVPVYLPPLRERPRDIPLLAKRFIALVDAREGRSVERELSPDALRTLLDHSWPGNVRELRNVIEYACAVGRGDRLQPADLPPELRGQTLQRQSRQPTEPGSAEPPSPVLNGPPQANTGSDLPLHHEEAERQRIVRALERTDWRPGKAANLLGVSRSTLWRKRRKYGI